MIEDIIRKTKEASYDLMVLDTLSKNKALNNICEKLESKKADIIKANAIDLSENKDKITDVMYKRLALDEGKIDSIIEGIKEVIALPDPIGEVLESFTVPSGLLIKKIRVPFGLMATIYESRPNVTVDIAVLAIKTGNACLLKGGKEAMHTSSLLVEIMKDAIKDIVNPDVINYVYSREDTAVVLKDKNIDLLIPRGNKKLIDFVIDNAKVPTIETGAGVCHIYVDENCDDEEAIKIIMNSKLSNPAVCNSVETILVNKKKAYLLKELKEKMPQVIYRGDQSVKPYLNCEFMNEDEYHTEYDDLILSVKVVDDLNEAIAHIKKYSTMHSDSILSNNEKNINKFFMAVDSACVYSNASTRFTDGGCFGFGAEIGIATSKLHARGPMGLKELTTYKYVITGHGEIRE